MIFYPQGNLNFEKNILSFKDIIYNKFDNYRPQERQVSV
jgi:hypothetical protein